MMTDVVRTDQFGQTLTTAPVRDEPTAVHGSGNGGVVGGQSPTDAGAGLLAGAEDLSKYEQVVARLLATGAVEHLAVAVTSAVSGEGVSTVCLGVALALARSTTGSVLLLDANLRRPALHDLIGVDRQPGLNELISGSRITAPATAVPNLWVVPSGAAATYPAQLITSDAAADRIRALRDRFDYVIVDCPPVLTAVEAASVCRQSSGVIMVVRAGVTPRDDIERARDLLRGVPMFGVVLNGV